MSKFGRNPNRGMRCVSRLQGVSAVGLLLKSDQSFNCGDEIEVTLEVVALGRLQIWRFEGVVVSCELQGLENFEITLFVPDMPLLIQAWLEDAPILQSYLPSVQDGYFGCN